VSGYRIAEALRGLAVLLFIASIIFIGLLLKGCTPAEQQAAALSAENALAVAQYDQALVECQQAARQKPKDQRFEAYADCEQAVSKRMCEASSELREHWARCKELQ
jgi:Tfp pilus assembly protein PilN